MNSEDPNSKKKKNPSEKKHVQKMIDNYLLYECVGEGQFGKVYKAIHQITNLTVAIKVVKIKRFKEVPKLEECTVNEIKALNMIDKNENIVQFIELLRSTNNFYFVYEFCNGGTLQEQLQTNRSTLPESQVLLIFAQILQAFRTLRRYNIIHRDLKPTNILLHNGIIKIADFGFCKFLSAPDQMAQTMLGSPLYMAPEILKGEDYGAKADIWSLGVVLYELLHGFCPFQEKSIAKLVTLYNNQDTLVLTQDSDKVSKATKLLLKAMLTIDPEQRISWTQLFQIKISPEGDYIVPKQYENQTEQTVTPAVKTTSQKAQQEPQNQQIKITKIISPPDQQAIITQPNEKQTISANITNESLPNSSNTSNDKSNNNNDSTNNQTTDSQTQLPVQPQKQDLYLSASTQPPQTLVSSQQKHMSSSQKSTSIQSRIVNSSISKDLTISDNSSSSFQQQYQPLRIKNLSNSTRNSSSCTTITAVITPIAKIHEKPNISQNEIISNLLILTPRNLNQISSQKDIEGNQYGNSNNNSMQAQVSDLSSPVSLTTMQLSHTDNQNNHMNSINGISKTLDENTNVNDQIQIENKMEIQDNNVNHQIDNLPSKTTLENKPSEDVWKTVFEVVSQAESERWRLMYLTELFQEMLDKTENYKSEAIERLLPSLCFAFYQEQLLPQCNKLKGMLNEISEEIDKKKSIVEDENKQDQNQNGIQEELMNQNIINAEYSDLNNQKLLDSTNQNLIDEQYQDTNGNNRKQQQQSLSGENKQDITNPHSKEDAIKRQIMYFNTFISSSKQEIEAIEKSFIYVKNELLYYELSFPVSERTAIQQSLQKLTARLTALTLSGKQDKNININENNIQKNENSLSLEQKQKEREQRLRLCVKLLEVTKLSSLEIKLKFDESIDAWWYQRELNTVDKNTLVKRILAYPLE